jgi:ABC-type lipoprotein export system ATPase subunit
MMLKACGIKKAFGSTLLFDNLNLEIQASSSCAIIGRSGEGKSTLLHILGSLELPDAGEIFFQKTKIDQKNAANFLKNDVGFIFQNFNVLEDFSILDNLKVAQSIRKKVFDKEKALKLLQDVGLFKDVLTKTSHLSGGEKQRLAIARALLHEPKLILADEPTGSLDQAQALVIEELLFSCVKKHNAGLILVTHDLDLASKCDKIVQLKDGNLRNYL